MYCNVKIKYELKKNKFYRQPIFTVYNCINWYNYKFNFCENEKKY